MKNLLLNIKNHQNNKQGNPPIIIKYKKPSKNHRRLTNKKNKEETKSKRKEKSQKIIRIIAANVTEECVKLAIVSVIAREDIVL